MTRSALVLFSGGQDSTACLAWALTRFNRVETVGFDYGQRHAIELECRRTIRALLPAQFPAWVNKLGDDHMIDLRSLGAISETALTRKSEITFQKDGLPNTFVPGRNLMFFTYAAAIAYRRDIDHLVGGMCETDYSGYPDCRRATLSALETAINLGTDRAFVIETPLMHLDKAATWKLAHDLGGDRLIELTKNETHTCYLGDRGIKHEWGYGCGKCPACDLRAKGYVAWNA